MTNYVCFFFCVWICSHECFIVELAPYIRSLCCMVFVKQQERAVPLLLLLLQHWVVVESSGRAKSALSMSFASVVVKLLHLRTAHLSVRLHIRSAIHCTLPWTHRDRCNKGAWRGSVRRSAATVVVIIDLNRNIISWKILSLSMRYYKKGGWIL